MSHNMDYKIMVDPLTEEEYAKCFKTYCDRTHEYDAMIEWTKEFFTENSYKDPKILSIGAGTGYFDTILIDNLPNQPSHYVAIEPNDAHFEKLKESM